MPGENPIAQLEGQNPPDHAEDPLRATLGIFTVTMLIIGGVMGSGIFRKPGIMAAEVGSPRILFTIWIFAGIITIFGALSNAEICSLIPETGGQYVFFEKMYGSFFAYLYGWSLFAVIQNGSIAALAYVFAEYSTQFLSLPELSPSQANWALHLPMIGDIQPLKEIGVKGLAVAIIAGLTIINYLGIRFGGWVQNIFTVAKVTGMLALILAAFFLSSNGSFSNLTTSSPVLKKEGFALMAAFVAALQGAFWAYGGWVQVSYIAGEVRNPQYVIPKAIALGMSSVMVIYLLMNAAYCYVLPIDQMAKSKLVAADAANAIVDNGGRWIAVIVMISTFGAINAGILATARVYYSMARRNVFPASLGRIHPRFQTPSAALVAQALWSCALVFSGTFDTLTDTLVFVNWIFFAAGSYGVFILRRTMPDAPRPFKVPGYPFVPAIFTAFGLIFLFVTIWNDIANYRAAVMAGKPAMINSVFGLVLVLLGAPLYLRFRRKTFSKEYTSS